MNRVEKQFKEKAIVRGSIMLFTKENALSFVKACKESGIQILGIDAFHLLEENIQPSLDNSVDFSSSEYSLSAEDIYSEAINFLRGKSDNLFFEIVCSD